MPQRLSECYHYGTPDDHELALDATIKFAMVWFSINDPRMQPTAIARPLKQTFPESYCIKNKLRIGYEHDYDAAIYFRFLELVIEIEGDIDFKFGKIKGKKTRHSHREQRENDGIAEAYINYYFPNCKFLRLKKEEILNPETGTKYLTDEFIKLYYS